MALTTSHVASWGVVSSHSKSDMVCISWNETAEAIQSPEINEHGSVIGQAVYDVRHTVRATFNIPSSVGADVTSADAASDFIGSAFGASGYYVTNLELVESNQDYTKVNVTMERYQYCTTNWDAST